MTDLVRRIKLQPRVALAAAAAFALVLIWWRRAQGAAGAEGPPTDVPAPSSPYTSGDFSAVPPGTSESYPEGQPPTVIPLPPQGGIIFPPGGGDPIIYQPPAPTPPPSTTPPAPRRLFFFNRYWRPGDVNAFHSEWARRQRRHKRPTTRAAWRSFLHAHAAVARFFGLAAFAGVSAGGASSSATGAAAAPRTTATAGSLTAPPSTVGAV